MSGEPNQTPPASQPPAQPPSPPPAAPPAPPAQPPAAPPPAPAPGQDGQVIDAVRHQQVLNELQEARQQLAQAQGALGGHTRQYNQLQSQFSTVQQQLDAANAALTDINSKYGTLEGQFTTTQAQLTTANEELRIKKVYDLIATKAKADPTWGVLVSNEYAIQAASLLPDPTAQENLLAGLAGSLSQARQGGADAIRNGSTVLPGAPGGGPGGAAPVDALTQAYKNIQNWYPQMPDAEKVWNDNMKVIEAQGKTQQQQN